MNEQDEAAMNADVEAVLQDFVQADEHKDMAAAVRVAWLMGARYGITTTSDHVFAAYTKSDDLRGEVIAELDA